MLIHQIMGTSNSTADESQEMPLSAPPSSEDIEDNPQPQTSPGVLTELFKWLVSVDPCFSVYYERFFSNKIDTLLLISVLQKDDLDFLESDRGSCYEDVRSDTVPPNFD